jgi:hypothetical protein
MITIVKLGPEKKRIDISRYYFVNSTIKLWNQESVRRVIVRRSEGMLKGGDETSKCAGK